MNLFFVGAGLEGNNLRKKWELSYISLFSLVFCVGFGLYLGQDINYDLRNYHLYTVYALLYNRLTWDVAASQLQTWTNPLGSILQYAIIMNLSPVIGTVLLSILSVPCIVAVYFISKILFLPLSINNGRAAFIINISSTIAAAVAPIFVSEIGTSLNDNIVSFFILLAILFSIFRDRQIFFSFWAGVSLGFAADIKLTSAVYVVGFAVAIILRRPLRFYGEAISSACGFLLSFLPIGGAWMLYIYHLYGNPIFPLYNDVFKSPAYSPVALRDSRFVSDSVSTLIKNIFGTAIGKHPSLEVYFVDIRYVILLVVLTVAILKLSVNYIMNYKYEHIKFFDKSASRFILCFVIVSFVLWAFMFGIERYLIPVAQLVPPCIFIALIALTRNSGKTVGLSVVIVIMLIATGRMADFSRVPFSDSWFDLHIPSELQKPNTLYVMLSVDPISFVVPYFPASDKFVHLQGNLPLSPADGLGQQALQAIVENKGEIRTLGIIDYPLEASDAVLQEFGLKFADGPCYETTSNRAVLLKSCPLVRLER